MGGFVRWHLTQSGTACMVGGKFSSYFFCPDHGSLHTWLGFYSFLSIFSSSSPVTLDPLISAPARESIPFHYNFTIFSATAHTVLRLTVAHGVLPCCREEHFSVAQYEIERPSSFPANVTGVEA